MPNTLTAAFPEVWSRLIQVPLRKSLVALEIANTELREELEVGYKIHYPYTSDLTVGNYTPGSDVTIQNVSMTDEYLTVDQKKVVAFRIDNFEQVQSRYDLIVTWSDEAAYRIRDVIDTAVLAETANAANPLDAGDIGGTAGNGIDIASADIVKVFSVARKKLRETNVEEAADWVAVVPPYVAEAIELAAVNKGFQIADATLRNGYAGDFLGFKIYVSNNLPVVQDGGNNDCYLAYIGKAKCIHLVMQMPPRAVIKDEPRQDAKNVLTFALYGTKVFNKNANRFLKAYFLAP